MGNPNDITDAEMRGHVLESMRLRRSEADRERMHRRAQAERLRRTANDEPWRGRQLRQEAAEDEAGAVALDRFIVEFDRAIAAVEREFEVCPDCHELPAHE